MKIERHLLQLLLLHLFTFTLSFVVNRPQYNSSYRSYKDGLLRLLQAPVKDQPGEDATNYNDELTDLDAKVLKSLLAENLDLATEERYQTVLKRSNDAKLRREREERDRAYKEKAEEFAEKEMEKEFSSTIFKTAMNWENIFGSLQAKAEEVFESVKIAVTNRIERDLKLSVTLGLFALDRAVKDTSRTIGAAKERTVFLLSDKSSFEDLKPNITTPVALFEDFNAPMNEIKDVTNEIKRLIDGADRNPTNSNSRVLKSFAPTGSSRNADRLKKAYERRKEMVFRREKEGLGSKIGRTATSITDAAWEMTSEIKSEVNKPGYRTESVRQAIGERTSSLLGGKVFQNLSIRERKSTQPQLQGNSNVVDASIFQDEIFIDDEQLDYVNYFDEFLKERAKFAVAIRLCLDTPEDTWLSKDLMDASTKVDEEDLTKVISAMVFARDNFESEINEVVDMSFYFVIQEFEKVEKTLDDLYIMAAATVGPAAADRLKYEIFEESCWSSKSMLAHKNEKDAKEKEKNGKKSLEDSPKKVKKSKVNFDLSGSDNIYGSYYQSRPQQEKGSNVSPFFYANTSEDRMAETVPQTASFETFSIDAEVVGGVTRVRDSKDVDFDFDREIVEDEIDVIVDDTIEESFFDVKVVEVENEKETFEERATPVAVTITLRTLDIILFVVEKTVIGLPRIISAGESILLQLDKVKRSGGGESQGWKLLESIQNGKDRY